MPEAALKMAIAGLGVMGRDHLKNALTLQQEGLLRLVGLADVEVERARRPGEEDGRARLRRPEALLDETRPDFVVVATPHPSHEAVTVWPPPSGACTSCARSRSPTPWAPPTA